MRYSKRILISPAFSAGNNDADGDFISYLDFMASAFAGPPDNLSRYLITLGHRHYFYHVNERAVILMAMLNIHFATCAISRRRIAGRSIWLYQASMSCWLTSLPFQKAFRHIDFTGSNGDTNACIVKMAAFHDAYS